MSRAYFWLNFLGSGACLALFATTTACVKPPNKRVPVRGAVVTPVGETQPVPGGEPLRTSGDSKEDKPGATTLPTDTTPPTTGNPTTPTKPTTPSNPDKPAPPADPAPPPVVTTPISRIDVRAFWKADAWFKTRALVAITGVLETQVAGTNKAERPGTYCAKEVGTSQSLYLSGFKTGKNEVTVGMQTSVPVGGKGGGGCLADEFSYPKAQLDIDAKTSDPATANRFKCAKGKMVGGGTRYQVCYDDSMAAPSTWTHDKQFLVFEVQNAEFEIVGLACTDSASIGNGAAGPNPCK